MTLIAHYIFWGNKGNTEDSMWCSALGFEPKILQSLHRALKLKDVTVFSLLKVSIFDRFLIFHLAFVGSRTKAGLSIYLSLQKKFPSRNWENYVINSHYMIQDC